VVREASKTFGQRQALRGVSFEIPPGQRVALLGASGSGKSTLLRCLCGLERTDAGTSHVEVFGRTLQSGGQLARDIRIQRRQVGIIFQQFNLVGRLPVMTNVLTGMAADVPLWRSLLGRFRLEDQARALDALDSIGLTEQAFQRASTLSGGQQQRAAIARAIVGDPKLILADEPTGNLDTANGEQVMNILMGLNGEGATIVMVTHSPAHADMAKRRIDMLDGRIVASAMRAI
jgi:phosphonate transport system ATP-binding protein